MTALIIGIILTMIAVAASLYLLNRAPDAATEALVSEYWWMTWPI